MNRKHKKVEFKFDERTSEKLDPAESMILGKPATEVNSMRIELMKRRTQVLNSVEMMGIICAAISGNPNKPVVRQVIEYVAKTQDELASLRARLDKIENDMRQAAGELMIDLPEPGTDLFKLLLANRVLMTRAEQAEADADRLAEELKLEQNPGCKCAALAAHEKLKDGTR